MTDQTETHRREKLQARLNATAARCPDQRATAHSAALLEWFNAGNRDRLAMPNLESQPEPLPNAADVQARAASIERSLVEVDDAEDAAIRARVDRAFASLYDDQPPTVARGLLQAVHPELFGPVERDPTLWSTALHEASHAAAAFVRGVRVIRAIVRRGGGGECGIAGLNRLAPVDAATVIAAGSWRAGPMQIIGDGSGDGEFYDRTANKSDLTQDAFDHAAIGGADRITDLYGSEIAAMGRLLYANVGEWVSGADLAYVFRFHDASRPNELRDQLKIDIAFRATLA